jgi:hypothetical protein
MYQFDRVVDERLVRRDDVRRPESLVGVRRLATSCSTRDRSQRSSGSGSYTFPGSDTFA